MPFVAILRGRNSQPGGVKTVIVKAVELDRFYMVTLEATVEFVDNSGRSDQNQILALIVRIPWSTITSSLGEGWSPMGVPASFYGGWMSCMMWACKSVFRINWLFSGQEFRGASSKHNRQIWRVTAGDIVYNRLIRPNNVARRYNVNLVQKCVGEKVVGRVRKVQYELSETDGHN